MYNLVLFCFKLQSERNKVRWRIFGGSWTKPENACGLCQKVCWLMYNLPPKNWQRKRQKWWVHSTKKPRNGNGIE